MDVTLYFFSQDADSFLLTESVLIIFSLLFTPWSKVLNASLFGDFKVIHVVPNKALEVILKFFVTISSVRNKGDHFKD